jgi:hypothetical protein
MKHHALASMHFAKFVLANLSRRGVHVIGVQPIPDMTSPLPYANATTGYVVSDNGCGKVWTRAEVEAASSSPYLSGIVDTVEEAETNALSLAYSLKEFASTMGLANDLKKEGHTVAPSSVEVYRETLRDIVYGVNFLAEMVGLAEKYFYAIFPEKGEEETAA